MPEAKADAPKTALDELRRRKKAARLGGGEARLQKHRAQGKLTARERVDLLLDRDSFQEQHLFARHRCTFFDMADKELAADGVITGTGTIDGRVVQVASQDFTVAGGAAGETHCNKIVEMMKASMKTGNPFVFINDSGGARVQEGVDSLSGYGRVFHANVMLSGVVPQIAVICGPCAGGAAYSPALTDFIIQTKQALMFITGPQVIKEVTGEEISAEALGGPDAHMQKSGVVHFVADDDSDAMRICKRLLSFLPANNREDPPHFPAEDAIAYDDSLNTLIPDNPRKPYDMLTVIHRVVDRGDFMEVQEGFAKNIIVGFGRVLGRTVGVIANQPNVSAGVLDIDASDKAARFIRFCNAFNVPLLNFVDVPGFLPGIKQEYGGIIRHGAKMLFAYSAATVPKVTVVVRKAYGGAYLAMCSKDLGADRVVAWPSAEIAVMGAEGAVSVVFRKEIEHAENRAEKRQAMIDLYRETFCSPYVAASRLLVDDVIEPGETRQYVALALEALVTKRELRPPKKHGLIPL